MKCFRHEIFAIYGSSNGWFMRTELKIIEVRLVSNLLNSHRTKPG